MVLFLRVVLSLVTMEAKYWLSQEEENHESLKYEYEDLEKKHPYLITKISHFPRDNTKVDSPLHLEDDLIGG